MNYYCAIDKYGKEWLFKTWKVIRSKKEATKYLREENVINYNNEIVSLNLCNLISYYLKSTRNAAAGLNSAFSW